MGRPRRIRRRLTLNVSEARHENPDETWTPGARFAHGWSKWITGHVGDCAPDPVMMAGYLAAKAAWDAHHYAVNSMDAEIAAN